MKHKLEGQFSHIAAMWTAKSLSGAMSDTEKTNYHAWLLKNPKGRLYIDEYLHILEKVELLRCLADTHTS